MKKYYVNIALGLLLCLTACKKDSGALSAGELVGKWHQTRLNLHETNGAIVTHDTTFNGDSFTDLDFYQFNRDKTAVISKSGNFGFGGKIIVINADVLFDFVTHYTYSVADSVLALKVTDIPPAILTGSNGLPYNQSPTIIQLDNNHLALRSIYKYDYNYTATQTQPLVGLTTTAYFIKVN